jgi:hypothetical protein
MFDPLRFRRDLALRIVGVIGTLSLASTPAGCSSSDGPAVSGTGGGVSAGTTTTGASAAGPMTRQCFKWSPDMGACPGDAPTVLAQFKCCGCPSGWEPATIDSAPTAAADDQCCYMVTLELCSGAGRPYRVDEQARVAAVEHGGGARGWTLGACPSVDGLGAGERALLTEAWMADASLEHASVASFSRFALALLAAGAPADLVERAHRAALDEVRHAKLCFALASAYAGADLAPGPFPLGGEVRVDASLVAIAVSTVKEGCLGETVAAVVAAEQLARAKDPAVRAALARIADDEARHAELAWRTVAWAVQAGGREVRTAVAQALSQALAGSLGAARHGSGPVAAAPGSETLAAHGHLDRAAVAAVTASAMADIVAPAARTLFQLETAA